MAFAVGTARNAPLSGKGPISGGKIVKTRWVLNRADPSAMRFVGTNGPILAQADLMPIMASAYLSDVRREELASFGKAADLGTSRRLRMKGHQS